MEVAEVGLAMGRWAWRAWHAFHWLLIVAAVVGAPVALVATGAASLVTMLVAFGFAAALMVLFGLREWRGR